MAILSVVDDSIMPVGVCVYKMDIYITYNVLVNSNKFSFFLLKESRFLAQLGLSPGGQRVKFRFSHAHRILYIRKKMFVSYLVVTDERANLGRKGKEGRKKKSRVIETESTT